MASKKPDSDIKNDPSHGDIKPNNTASEQPDVDTKNDSIDDDNKPKDRRGFFRSTLHGATLATGWLLSVKDAKRIAKSLIRPWKMVPIIWRGYRSRFIKKGDLSVGASLDELNETVVRARNAIIVYIVAALALAWFSVTAITLLNTIICLLVSLYFVAQCLINFFVMASAKTEIIERGSRDKM
jgi:hypothetical protein